MLCPAGVFMEKPHPLYTHTSPSTFKFSTHQQTSSAATSTSPHNSVKTHSSINQTGKTFKYKNPLPPHLKPASLFLSIALCTFF